MNEEERQILADDLKQDIQNVLSKLEVALDALESIKELTLVLQPNSGHMYLSTINSCFVIAKTTLDKIRDMK